jgi:hypothetical protein
MGLRDLARSLMPGNDAALAAELRQRAEDRAVEQRAKEAAASKARARRHKRSLPPLG